VSNSVLTYHPDPGFIGTDTFTYAAWDGSKNSNLATGTVSVAQGPWSIAVTAHVPPTYPAGWPVAFTAWAVASNTALPPSFQWNFGDGSAQLTNQFPAHAYSSPGTYTWSVVAGVQGATAQAQGTIVVGEAVGLAIAQDATTVTLSWPDTLADTLLESSGTLGTSAQWLWITNAPTVAAGRVSVTLPAAGNQFVRVRRPW
jgi:PKD repeat protein